MGTGSSLNCRTGSWAHPCSASGCHGAGTRPSPCDMQPAPSQKLPSDFLYTHRSRRAFTTLGCGHLHTCWHASNPPLTSLPSPTGISKQFPSLGRGNSAALLTNTTKPPGLLEHRAPSPSHLSGWVSQFFKQQYRRLAEPWWATLAGGRHFGAHKMDHSLIRMLCFLRGPCRCLGGRGTRGASPAASPPSQPRPWRTCFLYLMNLLSCEERILRLSKKAHSFNPLAPVVLI